MKGRLLLWAATCPSLLLSANIPVTVEGVTSTQAVLHYVAPSTAACYVVVKDSAGNLVNDTNETLFRSSSFDTRAGNVNQGRDRIVVVGTPNSNKAVDGLMHSRALAADGGYTVTVTCGANSGTASFHTNTVVLGDSSPRPFPYDPNGFGRYGFPTVDFSDTTKTYVDPQTGAILKNLTIGGFAGAGLHPDPWFYIYDIGSAWTNPADPLTGGSASYTGTGGQTKGLFIPFHFQDGNRGYMFYQSIFIDDVQLNITAGSSLANDTLSACLIWQGDTTKCAGTPFTISIPQGTPGAVAGPSSYPQFRFHGWGDPAFDEDQGEGDYPNATVAVSHSTVTITSNSPGSMPYTFPIHLVPGTKIHIAGSAPTCPNNECTVYGVRDGTHLRISQDLGAPFAGASTTLSSQPSSTSIIVSNASGFIQSQLFQAKTYNIRVGSDTVHCGSLSGNTFSNCSGLGSYSAGTAVTSNAYTIENWGVLVWPTAGSSRTVTISGGNFNYASSADYTTGYEGEGTICQGNVTVSYAANGATPLPIPLPGKICVVSDYWNDNVPLLGVLIPSTGEYRTIARLSSFGNTQDIITPTLIFEADASGNILQCNYDVTNGRFRELPHDWNGGTNPYMSCSSTPVVQNAVSTILAAYPALDTSYFGNPYYAGKVGNYVGYMASPHQDSLGWGCAFDVSKPSGSQLLGCSDLFSHYPMRWGDTHGGFNPFTDNGWFKFFSGYLGNQSRPGGPFKQAVSYIYNNSGSVNLSPTFTDPQTCEQLGVSTQWQSQGATGNNCIKINTPAEPLYPAQSILTSPPSTGYGMSTTGTPGTKPMAWTHNSTSCKGDNNTPAALLNLHMGFDCSSYLQPIAEGDWLEDVKDLGNDGGGPELFFVAKKTVKLDGTIDLVLSRQAGAVPTPYCVGQMQQHGASGIWFLAPIPVRECGGNVFWINASDGSIGTSSPKWEADDPRGYMTHTVLLYTQKTESLTNWSVGSGNLGGYQSIGEYGFGYGIRSGPFPGVITTNFPQYAVGSMTPFAGDLNGTDGNQSHPGENIEYNGAGQPFITGLDGRPFGTAAGGVPTAFNQTVTRVSGTTNTYKMGPVLGARLMNINIKVKEVMGWHDHTLMQDASGPRSASTFGDSMLDTFCYAYKAGECISGSLQGDVYAALTYANTAGACIVDMTDRAPCVVPVAHHAFRFTQYDVNKSDPLDSRQRILTSYLDGAGFSDNYANHHGTDGGGWIIGSSHFANGGRSMLMGVKDARWQEDSENRTDFVQVPITLSGKTGDVVRIRFGYNPNLYCTTRKEQCSTGAANGDPFAFATVDAVNWQACDSGCTVNIAAYANRVLYYQIDRKNGSTSMTSATQILAVQ